MELASSLYHIKFYGGPRDGDDAYQILAPPDCYDIPFHVNVNTPELLGVPVTLNEPLSDGVEAHHYELAWLDPKLAVFVYKGVKVF